MKKLLATSKLKEILMDGQSTLSSHGDALVNFRHLTNIAVNLIFPKSNTSIEFNDIYQSIKGFDVDKQKNIGKVLGGSSAAAMIIKDLILIQADSQMDEALVSFKKNKNGKIHEDVFIETLHPFESLSLRRPVHSTTENFFSISELVEKGALSFKENSGDMTVFDIDGLTPYCSKKPNKVVYKGENNGCIIDLHHEVRVNNFSSSSLLEKAILLAVQYYGGILVTGREDFQIAVANKARQLDKQVTFQATYESALKVFKGDLNVTPLINMDKVNKLIDSIDIIQVIKLNGYEKNILKDDLVFYKYVGNDFKSITVDDKNRFHYNTNNTPLTGDSSTFLMLEKNISFRSSIDILNEINDKNKTKEAAIREMRIKQIFDKMNNPDQNHA